MAVDISSQLEAIKSKSSGEDVLNNVDSALEKLVKLMYPGSAIKGELTVIREGTYGKDIRMAIHDALYKLSQQESGSSSGAIFISDPTTFRLSTNMISAIIPTECAVIGSEAFKGITSIESVVIPEGTIEIQDDAFLNCSSLLEIEIPDNNITFGKHCFKGCESITEIDLPTNVNIRTASEIVQEHMSGGSLWPDDYARDTYVSMFDGCESLTTVDMPENLWFISDSMFKGTGLTNVSNIITPTIYTIGESAFEGSAITQLVLPEKDEMVYGSHCVIDIYDSAFKDCKQLTYADLTHLDYSDDNMPLTGNGVNSVSSMFMGCENLETVKMPASSDWYYPVGTQMFSGCTKLANVFLTDRPTRVYESGFANCTSLKSFQSEDVINPDVGSFENCTSLETIKLTFDTPKKIPASSFSGCESLTSVVITDYNNSSSLITSIDAYAFENCKRLIDIRYPSITATVSEGTAVRIPYTVTSIGQFAFTECSAMEKFEYVIPDGQTVKLTSIGNYAFSNCTNLANLPIAKTVTSMGSGMCRGCESLVTITLPRNTTTMPAYGFQDCYNLRTVTVNTENPSTTVIGEKYTTIGEGCFSGCRSLTSIELQSTIKTIAKTAFYGCSSLTSFTLPTAVTSVGIQAFAGCTGLTTFTENAKTYSVGEKCFSGCTSLTSITLSMPTSIGASTFENCTALQSATISKQTGSSSYMFDGCTSLTSITAPLWTSIGTGCFRGCVGFVNFILPPKVTTINANAFEGCSNMVTFTPSSASNPVLRTINANAFLNCTSLTTVNLPNTMTTINSSAFAGCDGVTFNINRKENAISGYTTGWGATNFTINWTGTV